MSKKDESDQSSSLKVVYDFIVEEKQRDAEASFGVPYIDESFASYCTRNGITLVND